MKVKVKLYGTLSKFFNGYDQAKGIDLDIPKNSRIRDITRWVEVDEASIGMVAINGKLVKADAEILEGDEVKFFQPIAGG
jgi:molybdopterin converting factor small subunit